MPRTPEGSPNSRIRIHARVNASTYEILKGFPAADQISNSELGKKRRQGRPAGPDLGPLLDMIAGYINQFIETLPPNLQARFNRRRKLTSFQVREIRASDEPRKCIAMEHGISMAMVSYIRNGRAYRWVK